MQRSIVAPVRAIVLTGVVVAACGSTSGKTAAPSAGVPLASVGAVASPSTGATPNTTAPGTPLPSLAPRPSGTLAWPATFATPFAQARYFAAPPFALPLSLAITEDGWYAGHLHPAFIDIQRFDGVDVGSFPTRMLGLGWPDAVRGVDGPVPVAGLGAAAAIDQLRGRSSVAASNRAKIELLGLQGERIDLHSDLGNNPIFETADGPFGLGPELDVRLVALPLDGRLLLIAVLAPASGLEAAWKQALPMLQSARLEG